MSVASKWASARTQFRDSLSTLADEAEERTESFYRGSEFEGETTAEIARLMFQELCLLCPVTLPEGCEDLAKYVEEQLNGNHSDSESGDGAESPVAGSEEGNDGT